MDRKRVSKPPVRFSPETHGRGPSSFQSAGTLPGSQQQLPELDQQQQLHQQQPQLDQQQLGQQQQLDWQQQQLDQHRKDGQKRKRYQQKQQRQDSLRQQQLLEQEQRREVLERQQPQQLEQQWLEQEQQLGQQLEQQWERQLESQQQQKEQERTAVPQMIEEEQHENENRRHVEQQLTTAGISLSLHPREETTSATKGRKRRKKLLTLDDLKKKHRDIEVISVKTDLDEEPNQDGTWSYFDSKCCQIVFTVGKSEVRTMRLAEFLARGVSTSSFRWYSWIRLKKIAKKNNSNFEFLLTDEKSFMCMLHEINKFYSMHPALTKSEGLQPNCGPQSFTDSTNLDKLHYYGSGTIKYYRKTTFVKLLGERFGENIKADYLVNRDTPVIQATDFEELLLDVNNELAQHARHLNKLKQYAGPQCDEDRKKAEKVNYDVKFTSNSSAKQPYLCERHTNDERESDNLEVDKMKEFYLRKCNLCNKLRWLDRKSAQKFVLGSYFYNDQVNRVHFSCNMLCNTSCSDESDIVRLDPAEEYPNLWLVYTTDQRNIPLAFMLQTQENVSAGISKAEVVTQYPPKEDSCMLKNFQTVALKRATAGCVQIGELRTTGRFKRHPEMPKFNSGKLTTNKPRTALVCQSWLDGSKLSSEDPSAVYTVHNLKGIRDVHSTYAALRMIQCSQCGRSSPGLDLEITIPEGGTKVPMTNPDLQEALSQSLVLSKGSVKLDEKFGCAKVITNKSVSGICTNCSKYCEVDDNGNVYTRHSKQRNEDNTQSTLNSQEDLQDNISNINPYSVENLMALDVFKDDASLIYSQFMDTLSRAEKLVLSPIHAVIVILRSRTNNIPFSRHGSIAFQMKEPTQTRSLPWHTFQELPFVVMVSTNEDGTIEEAKINMAKIVRAKELMEREVQCPVYGTKRPFYRYCDQLHSPFTVTAMETLASQLSSTDFSVYPSGLRTINIDTIHQRATKKMTRNLFSEWVNSGYTIGSSLKDSFAIENCTVGNTHESIVRALWGVFRNYAKQASNEIGDLESSEVDVTAIDVVKCAVQKGWLNATNDVSSASQRSIEAVPLPDDELKKITFLCCEEIELLLRESSNDEGDATSTAQGGVSVSGTERPEEILRRGIRDTVLDRIPAPEVDKESPVPENTPGYLPMAFPDVFLTGDGCPHQERPRDIRNDSERYIFTYLQWVSQQPRAMISTELQFLIHSMIKRQHSRSNAKLGLRFGVLEKEKEIPVKEDLVKNASKCEWTATNLLMFKSHIPDSTPFWKRTRDDAISVQRDWEEVVPWRPDKEPMTLMLFQTRAPPYNHHPAIHNLFYDCDESDLTDQEFLEMRQRNVLQYPSVVTFVCALMAELDTRYISKLRYGGSSYFTRFEWGANANPHSHRLLFSQDFSAMANSLKNRIETCFENTVSKTIVSGLDLGNPIVHDQIQTTVSNCWDEARSEYIEYMRPSYTSWNAGLLADGQTKTFDFVYDRKSTICRLDMPSLVDNTLTSGDFTDLDTLYVTVANGTCRHLGHSGINDQPSKSDKCAVVKKKLVKDKTSEKKYREVVTCKRRKPNQITDKPTIEPDPHNNKLMQLQFECNDKWFNGHDPFQILHVLSNADDKAIVPDFLRKPPKVNSKGTPDEVLNINWELSLEFYSEVGDSATDYVSKYAFKDVINAKTSSEILITAMENLQDGEQLNQGTVQKMYNTHAIAGTTSIFQATHLNMRLPHVLSNVNIKTCSVSNISLLRRDYSEGDGENFTVPALVKVFDQRHNPDVICRVNGKPSEDLKKDIQKDICLHQFCDLYDYKEVKGNSGERQIVFTKRANPRQGRLNALKLTPCHVLRVANPRNKMHWHYCRTLCLWKIPCHKTTDFSPETDDEEEAKEHWVELFNKSFPEGNGLPPWAKRFWNHFNRCVPSEEADMSSSEDGDANEDEFLIDQTEGTTNDIPVAEDEQIDDSDAETAHPFAQPGNEQFYQDPVDRMRGNLNIPQDTTEDVEETHSDILANPEGIDFMYAWLGDRVIPSIGQIHAKVADLINKEGSLSDDSFDSTTLNEKQRMAHDLVVNYVRNRLDWDLKGCKGPPPKPLRLFLMGNPGTGKSWTLKCFMSTLIKVIRDQIKEQGKDEQLTWNDMIKLAAPTGAASSHMHFKAETLHRLFCIPIQLNEKNLQVEESSPSYFRLMQNFNPKNFILLVIDEFSMVSRQMFAFLTERLQQCKIDLDKIGIVLIGDPAQILPIGGDPLWSARIHMDGGKDCNSMSILGMTRFRQIFGFPQIQKVSKYECWKSLTTTKQRLLSTDVTTFRKKATDGSFDAVFLTEIKRTEEDAISQKFTGEILVNLRYGRKCRSNEINFLRENTAKKADIAKSDSWRNAHIIHGYHFHSKEHGNRGSVEADNARALLVYHEKSRNPIMRIDSLHRPAEKSEKLKHLSAKEFEGAPPSWHACKDMRVMLLRNIAPSFGLYNGSLHTLVGPIYSKDTVQVSLTCDQLRAVGLEGCLTTHPIDVSSKEKQIPPKSTLVTINGVPFSDEALNVFQPKESLQCRFRLPRNPPAMPDFMVIKASNYDGPSILELTGCEDYVPIPPVESYKSTAGKTTSKVQQTRVALPLEGGDAATGFKGQGSTFDRAEVDLEGWFQTPGIFLVAISRVRSPAHLHIRRFPNYMDIKLQRLKENVLDGQAFEEAIRAKSEWAYRHRLTCEDSFWGVQENVVADCIIRTAQDESLRIKKNSDEIMEKIIMEDSHLDRELLQSVVRKLIATKEYLVCEPAPHVKEEDYETLSNYQKNRKPPSSKSDDGSKQVRSTKTDKKQKQHKQQTASSVECPPRSNTYITRDFLFLKDRPNIENGQTLKGLQNSGNNICFINAAIVALCQTSCFDEKLRMYHEMHQGCQGNFGDNVCTLCALFEVINRCYSRHHDVPSEKIGQMPIIKLTKILLPGWTLREEHDSDEFLTQLLEHMDQNLQFNIDSGNVKTVIRCVRCGRQESEESLMKQRIHIYVAEFQTVEVVIQDGINRWMAGRQEVRDCETCGPHLHHISCTFLEAPRLLLLSIHRVREQHKRTLLDDQVVVNQDTFIFRSAIIYYNNPTRHYATISRTGQNRYVYYSDQDVHTCTGDLRQVQQRDMNRVVQPLMSYSRVLLYEKL